MRRSRTSQVLVAATAAASIVGLSLSSTAPAVSAVQAPSDAVHALDSRVGALVRPTQEQVDAVAAIVKASPGTRATWDGRFGTVRTLTPAIGSTLSGPRSGSAVDVARAWLTAHAQML